MIDLLSVDLCFQTTRNAGVSAAQRLSSVLGMLSSLEVQVLRPTWWRWRP